MMYIYICLMYSIRNLIYNIYLYTWKLTSRQVGCHDFRPQQRVWLSCWEPCEWHPEQVQLAPREFAVLSGLLSLILAIWMLLFKADDVVLRLLCLLSLCSSCLGGVCFCRALRRVDWVPDEAAREAYEQALEHARVAAALGLRCSTS